MKEVSSTPKDFNDILDEQIKTSVHEFKRSNARLFLSGISAGLEVGFSVFLIGAIFSLLHDEVSPSVLHILLAMAYPLGFILVVIGKSELFTEHTTLAFLPVLNKKVSIGNLFQLWGIILSGNLVGGFVMSGMLVYIAPDLGSVSEDAFSHIANHIIHHSTSTIFVSAIMAGWLMGLLSWLMASAQETISRILLIMLITFTIGVCSLHHSIVGSIEVFSGFLLDPNISIWDYVSFEVTAIVGNMVGGVVFVAIIKNSQRRKDL